MNAHIATPWGIELDYRDRTKTIITSKLDDYMVASCNHACNDPQNEANAAFICRACNEYESDRQKIKALKEALQEAMTYIVRTKNESEQYETTVYDQCKQALNLAEGRE